MHYSDKFNEFSLHCVEDFKKKTQPFVSLGCVLIPETFLIKRGRNKIPARLYQLEKLCDFLLLLHDVRYMEIQLIL